MDISLPDRDTVRRLLAKVRENEMDGMVVTFQPRGQWPHLVLAERVLSKKLAEKEYTVTSAGRWLLYELLEAYLPHDIAVSNRTRRVEELGIFSGNRAFQMYYQGPANCFGVQPELAARASTCFAQGDETLRQQLEEAFALAPTYNAQRFKRKYLVGQPSPERGESVQRQ